MQLQLQLLHVPILRVHSSPHKIESNSVHTSLPSSKGLSNAAAPFLLDCAVSISPILRVAEPTNACSGIRVARLMLRLRPWLRLRRRLRLLPFLPIFCKVSCGGGRSLFAAIHTFPFPLCASRELRPLESKKGTKPQQRPDRRHVIFKKRSISSQMTFMAFFYSPNPLR